MTEPRSVTPVRHQSGSATRRLRTPRHSLNRCRSLSRRLDRRRRRERSRSALLRVIGARVRVRPRLLIGTRLLVRSWVLIRTGLLLRHKAGAARTTEPARTTRRRTVTLILLLPDNNGDDDREYTEDTSGNTHDDKGAQPAVLVLTRLVATGARCTGSGRPTGGRGRLSLRNLQRTILRAGRDVVRQRSEGPDEAIPVVGVRELHPGLPWRQASRLHQSVGDLTGGEVRELGTEKCCGTRDVRCGVRGAICQPIRLGCRRGPDEGARCREHHLRAVIRLVPHLTGPVDCTNGYYPRKRSQFIKVAHSFVACCDHKQHIFLGRIGKSLLLFLSEDGPPK